MKKSMMKVLALALAMLMAAFTLSACGSGSSESGESGGSEAEANAGIGGIVFNVPDGWENTGIGESYVFFSKEGSDFRIMANTTDNNDIEELKQYSEEFNVADIQEYFSNQKANADNNADMETEDITLCGNSGYKYKTKTDGGYADEGVLWIYEDVLYFVGIQGMDSYDEGGLKDDAPALSDEEISDIEAIIASIQPGDGDAMMKNAMGSVNSVGEITFEVPEGFSISSSSGSYLNLANEDGISLSIYIETAEDIAKWAEEDPSQPATPEEYYEQYTEYMDDTEKTTIAGYDGFIQEDIYEDGKCYSMTAGFVGEEGYYSISVSSAEWDENGNLSDDSKELTDANKEMFKTFVASLAKK